MPAKTKHKQNGHALEDREDLLGKPRTARYSPVDHARWFMRPRDLPPFAFTTILAMMLDPTIRLGLAMRAAPMFGLEFAHQKPGADDWTPGIEASHPVVAAFVMRQLERIWLQLDALTPAQAWGWAACEVTYRQNQETKYVEIDRLLARHSNDTRALVREGEVCGVRFMRIGKAGAGQVDLEFPYCIFHAHAPEPGSAYGMSIMQGAYSPWADKWLNGGALDVRRLFMHKDAYGGADLGFPPGTTNIDGKGEVPNRDIAREIVEQMQAGAVTTRPSETDPTNGKERWPLTRAVVPSNPAHILQFPKDLDIEILRGMEFPDDIFMSSDSGTTGWSGKTVPMQGFYCGLDRWAVRLLRDITPVIAWGVVLNFGPQHWFKLRHKPLGKQAMEQQGAGKGKEQPSIFGGFGRDGDSDGQFGEGGNGFPPKGQQRMSLDPEAAVGQGVLDAAELVKAASKVIRMRTGEGEPEAKGGGDKLPAGSRWVTIGGRKQGDREHVGGFPVLIDADGNILRSGGPKGLVGKHVSKSGEHFEQERSRANYAKQREAEASSPLGKSRSWRKIVEFQADKWKIDPDTYEGIASQVWEDDLTMWEEREAAKAFARKSLKLTAADINRLENQGFDAGSQHKRIKGLDTLGREMASLYPSLGWGEGWGSGEDRSDYDEMVWELVKEGKNEQPSRISTEFHERVDDYLQSELRRHRNRPVAPEEEYDATTFGLRMGQARFWDEDEHPRDDEGKFTDKAVGDAPTHSQQALFAKAGKPGQGNLFADRGVPDAMVAKRAEEQSQRQTKVAPSSVDSPAQGVLQQAKKAKAAAWKQVQSIRQQIRDKPLSRGGLTIPLMRAEEAHRAAQKMERDALAAIEKRANELGQTTKANA